MPGIGVVTNPLSRRNRRNPRLIDRLAYILGDRGELAAPRDLAGLDEVARYFCDREIELLCINGGDGTGHVVLSAMVRAYGERPLPPVALLRGGTMNTVAHGLGIRGSPEKLLARAVRKLREGEPFRLVTRHLLVVDGRHYGFLFGNGVVSNFLELYYEGSEPSPSKALRLLARSIASLPVGGPLLRRLLAPVRVQLRLDGERISQESFLTVAAGTVDDLGFGFRPFWAAPRSPGRFHFLGLSLSPARLVAQLHRIYRGLPLRGKGVLDRLGTELRIAGNRPQRYMVDGDFHTGGQEITLRVGPPVQLVVG